MYDEAPAYLYICVCMCIHTYIHYNTIQYITLQYTTLHYIALHTYITLHYTTLHYITIHYIRLHYITLHSYIHTLHTHIHIHTRVLCTLYTSMCIYIYNHAPPSKQQRACFFCREGQVTLDTLPKVGTFLKCWQACANDSSYFTTHIDMCCFYFLAGCLCHSSPRFFFQSFHTYDGHKQSLSQHKLL